MEIYVSPLQTEKFATPQPGRNREDNHEPSTRLQLSQDRLNFLWLKYDGISLSLRTLPDESDGILIPGSSPYSPLAGPATQWVRLGIKCGKIDLFPFQAWIRCQNPFHRNPCDHGSCHVVDRYTSASKNGSAAQDLRIGHDQGAGRRGIRGCPPGESIQSLRYRRESSVRRWMPPVHRDRSHCELRKLQPLQYCSIAALLR
jgi:hypothetical protein